MDESITAKNDARGGEFDRTVIWTGHKLGKDTNWDSGLILGHRTQISTDTKL